MSRVAHLERVDWNFPSAGTAANTVHSGRSFPGNFIPQIPATLIAALSKPGDVVLDPFSGSGTTAVEALALSRQVICSDLITASVHFSRAKVEAFLSPPNEATRHQILSALTWPHLCETADVGLLDEGSAPELERWMAPRTLARLKYIWKLLEKTDGAARQALQLIFSDVLFSCASPGRTLTSTGGIRRHHWGWIADNVYPTPPVEHDPIELFLRKLSGLPSLTKAQKVESCHHIVMQQDARRMALRDGSIDLVVTSPPYVGMIDYARANRILYLWYGWNIQNDQTAEIGARYKRFRKEAQENYLSEMLLCWREVVRVLKSGAHLALVIGESKKFQGTVERTLAQLRDLMPLVWGPVQRVPTRRRVSDRSAMEPVEHVCVFQKQ